MNNVNMATYASTTNPFIKSNSSSNNNVQERSCKKDAPGMARPQSLVYDLGKKGTENDLLLNNNDSAIKMSWDTMKSEPCAQELGEALENDVRSVNDLSKDHQRNHDEITQAVDSLVEAAIRLELEEQSKKSDNSVSTPIGGPHTHCEKSSRLNLDDEDEEDDENEPNDDEMPPPMEQDSRRHQHIELIKKLRLQLRDLERYAYERGELDQVPQSVLTERQSVILDTLKNKLSLNISADEIEKLELDELKQQVDKEIHDLMDPLITKEHLLGQLKTQLTDLERYIAHLHGTLGKIRDKRSDCSCQLHGCSSQSKSTLESALEQDKQLFNSPNNIQDTSSSLVNNNALPKTSRLIRSLVTQLICSDIKLQETAKKDQANQEFSNQSRSMNTTSRSDSQSTRQTGSYHFNDDAAWSLHIDKVMLATDSLVNLFTLEPQYQRPADKPVDESLIESVVRRQLVPALRDLLTYGLIDLNSLPRSTSYAALFFDPYYILSSLTCFPSSQKSNNSVDKSSISDRIHVWNVIEEYYNSRNEPGFKSSSIKTLSQSFNLAPSISGPIKITSKQALLIAIEDIIETLSKCKPNGPESHFRSFIYTALNRSKLPTWLRLIFKNKSVIRKYYHNFSFVSQSDKMNKLLTTIEPLNQFEFKLRTDVESIEQFVSAF